MTDRPADGPGTAFIKSSPCDDKSRIGHAPDMPEVMRSLDVLVMCSHNEAMPNSVLEAMASGVAVIDQSGGGGPEAIAYGGAGRLVQAPGAAALATAVSEVASDGHLRRSIAAAGRRRAEEVYSLAAMTKAMLPVYEGLLEGRAEDRESR
jgi:glycosyltransferase involved in cell wall biosynthesis